MDQLTTFISRKIVEWPRKIGQQEFWITLQKERSILSMPSGSLSATRLQRSCQTSTNSSLTQTKVSFLHQTVCSLIVEVSWRSYIASFGMFMMVWKWDRWLYLNWLAIGTNLNKFNKELKCILFLSFSLYIFAYVTNSLWLRAPDWSYRCQ